MIKQLTVAQSPIDIKAISPQKLASALFVIAGMEIDVLRLDLLHPIISGNKWFKLKYFLQDASEKKLNKLVTFGGAFSNHIVAAAFAAKENGFDSIGIIRGKEPAEWSPTLIDASNYGMKFQFVGRSEYAERNKENLIAEIEQQYGPCYLIPEGGMGLLGKKGAGEILKICDTSSYTHIIAAVGTGTTVAGLIDSSLDSQEIIGISVMKNNPELIEDIRSMVEPRRFSHFRMMENYHFGGYAKKNDELIRFMNQVFVEENLPTDFVYTAKLLYAVHDLNKRKYFPNKSKILVIHSGGLQGNRSLPAGILLY